MDLSDDNREQRIEDKPQPLLGSLVEVVSADDDDYCSTENDSVLSLSSASSHSVELWPRRRQKRTSDDDDNNNSIGETDGGDSAVYDHDESDRQSRQQMIESLVRFSYHTPNAVLEDLINHELKLCEMAQKQKEMPEAIDQKKGSSSHGSDKAGEDRIPRTSRRRIGGRSDANVLKNRKDPDTKIHNTLPPIQSRESALVFIDISGFTKLSTMLDEETLSRVINSYFEMIIGEVKAHGGDVLKFAGDALFVEWRVSESKGVEKERSIAAHGNNNRKVLEELNSSLASMDTTGRLSTSSGLSIAVLRAARCAAAIVMKYSDHEVGSQSHISGALSVLNVHCGVGCGELVGIHTSDYKEEAGIAEEDQVPETRREYLFLGNSINQVSKAANMALNGEVLISTEALCALSECCYVPIGMIDCRQPLCIASRNSVFLDLSRIHEDIADPGVLSGVDPELDEDHNLRKHCRRLPLDSLSRLHSQVALYVHPVVRGDVWGSTANAVSSDGKEDILQRHHTEAELRTVYTIFVKAMVTPELGGDATTDDKLFSTLRNMMHLTCRELDRFSGQLRQFIVDDKGVVLIAVFGLRGSTFSDMVANNALPACFAIQKALSTSGVETRIGATMGKAYCGVVGALRRHEFSVMGAPVNLAARLMDSPMNNGLLVDENVRNNANRKYAFRSLKPVKAKGYDAPVGILEPVHEMASRVSRKSKPAKFVGREDEKTAIAGFADTILNDPLNAHAFVVNVVGDSGIGKSAMIISAMSDIKHLSWKKKKVLVSLRSSSTEDQQRIPLSAFRKILLGAIRELCFRDGSVMMDQDFGSSSSEIWQNESPLIPSKHLFDGRSNRARSLTSVNYHQGYVTTPAQNLSDASFSPTFSRSGSLTLNRDSVSRIAMGRFPYLEKLRWACHEAGYSEQFAHLIACQFLGIKESLAVPHFNGDVPQISDLVECIAQCFIKLVDFADITVVFIDDFQWVDTFTWRVVRALSQSAKRVVILRASRSHDKRALRRLSNGMSKGVNSSMEITLGPLKLEDIRDLISHILVVPNEDGTIDDDVCTYVYQKTGGLPVYVIELLETMKRTKALIFDDKGQLRLAAKTDLEGEECSSLVLNQMLSRFDSLDPLVRKILHTCAVLGQSFSLSDVIRVHHPGIKISLIEDSLNVAVSEMILLELGEEEDDRSTCSVSSHAGSKSHFGASVGHSKTSSRLDIEGERSFEFSYDMWRKTVLATLLNARKVKLHRLIAIAMERELDAGALQRSDLSRLLTLFEHWKLCGEFFRAAPLALAISSRLNDWDLLDLSIDICKDALDMSLRSVTPAQTDKEPNFGDWTRVSASSSVLSCIMRLNVRIGENFRVLGRIMKCVRHYEDAYTTLHSCSIQPPDLLLPVLVGLLSIDFERDETSEQNIPGDELLIEEFLGAARETSNPIHITRALSMKAHFHAQRGYFEKALEDSEALRKVYDARSHSHLLTKEYGKDYAMDVLSQSAMWFFLSGQEKEAVEQSVWVVKQLLSLQNPLNIDSIMTLLLPAILVLKFVGRGEDAHYIFCRYVVNAHHDLAVPSQSNWVEIFNPLIYLLEIVKMEEKDVFNTSMLNAIQEWVLNDNNSYFFPDHLRLGHTFMGEICYRLGQLKPLDGADSMRGLLLQKARSFLTPIARDIQSEPFLAHSALAFLRAMD